MAETNTALKASDSETEKMESEKPGAPTLASPVTSSTVDGDPNTRIQPLSPTPTSETPPPDDQSATVQESTASSNTQPKTTPADTASIDIVVRDGKQNHIPNLGVRVINLNSKKSVLFEGKTDKDGAIPTINNLPISTRFEIQLQRDDGTYKFAAIGTIGSNCRHSANLCIPRERFEFSTYSHDGKPGNIESKRTAAIAKHNQTPATEADVSRNANATNIPPQVGRNSDGNPTALVLSGFKNIFNQNNDTPPPAGVGLADQEKVIKLIDFATKQLAWDHPKQAMTSAVIIAQMKAGNYAIKQRAGDNPGYGFRYAEGKCAKYVKIALWKAGYSVNDGDIDPATGPARLLGPGLLRSGFKDITGQLPDARWAAPGDVIVYKKIADPSGAGHIDIRTYDGYISDFYETYLPSNAYEVIGVYRKYYDPLPDLRVRAFLKILRSREAKALFRQQGDKMTYRAAQGGGTFDGFKNHPFSEEKRGHPSGAYGIFIDTYNLYTKTLPKGGHWVSIADGVDKFSPTIQDRIAVAIMELAPKQDWNSNKGITALGMIRKGNIVGGAKLLASSQQWPSLPGGGQEAGYTIEQMLKDYKTYYDELLAGKQ